MLDSDTAICCDLCNNWIHISCDNLSIDDYNDMVDNPSDKPWFCSVCSEPSSGDSNLSTVWLYSYRITSQKFCMLMFEC